MVPENQALIDEFLLVAKADKCFICELERPLVYHPFIAIAFMAVCRGCQAFLVSQQYFWRDHDKEDYDADSNKGDGDGNCTACGLNGAEDGEEIELFVCATNECKAKYHRECLQELKYTIGEASANNWLCPRCTPQQGKHQA
jgi:hypothetical protein